MSARRLLATAALLATATLAVTACDPNNPGADAPPATAAPSASASSSAQPTASAQPSGKPSAKPTTAHSGSAKPTGKGTPTADCTTAAQHPGHKVINVTAATATQVTATPTRFVCGPTIDDDGYYQPIGGTASYTFAPGATAELFVQGDASGPRSVPLTQFANHAGDCAHQRPVPEPYSCFGGNYDITVDGSGRITKISELYHP
ncbi:hypothetical protein [Kitasatospora sp. NPDC059571]|uniref:hypothetical protein n=1 Tax=Kitasatospora sp. NPDC059571 TaxID=3346871 RepID=UPI0036B525B5